MHIAARMAVEGLPVEQRREPRADVTVQTSMRALGYHGINVVIRNLSESGFMAETEAAFAEGSYVRLKLPCLGTVLARIAWVREGEVGGEFLNTVAPSRLRMVVGMGAA